jgi:hypothetical protein
VFITNSVIGIQPVISIGIVLTKEPLDLSAWLLSSCW